MTFTAKHGRKFREYLGLKYLYEEIRPRGDCNSRVALQHLKGSKLINTEGVFFLPNGPQLTASFPARRGGALGSPVMTSRQQGLAAGWEVHVSTSVPCHWAQPGTQEVPAEHQAALLHAEGALGAASTPTNTKLPTPAHLPPSQLPYHSLLFHRPWLSPNITKCPCFPTRKGVKGPVIGLQCLCCSKELRTHHPTVSCRLTSVVLITPFYLA